MILRGRANARLNIMSDLKKCFVIGPIGSQDAPVGSPAREVYETAIEVFEKIIAAACEQRGLSVERSDVISLPGEINGQIIARLKNEDLVIADLTGSNPNVMYELGWRHSTGKATVHIAEYGRLPFDISTHRTIQFTRTAAGLVDGRKRLEKAIDAVLHHLGHAAIPAEAISDETVIATESPSDELPGSLELMADLEDGLPASTALIQQATEILSRINLAMDRAKAKESATSRERLALANHLAEELRSPAEALESLAGHYESELRRLSPGMILLLDHLDSVVEPPPEALTFARSTIQFADTMRNAREKSEPLAATFESLGQLTRQLAPQMRRLAAAVRRIASATTLTVNWRQRLIQRFPELIIE